MDPRDYIMTPFDQMMADMMLEEPYVPFVRVPDTTPAADALIGTVELMSNILSRLNYAELQRTKTVSKNFKQVIDNAPEVQEAMFMRAADNLPQIILEDQAEGKVINVEYRGQPLNMLSHFEKLGGLVFGGLTTNFMTHSPPLIYPGGSTWLFVRRADGPWEDTPDEGSWRDLLLKSSGDAMGFDVVLSTDEDYINATWTVFIGGSRTLGELVKVIWAEFDKMEDQYGQTHFAMA